MSIVPHEQFTSPDGIEIVIEKETGAAYFSQSGYARMSGLTQQAISKRCGTYNQNELKVAETPTRTGLKSTTLIPGVV